MSNQHAPGRNKKPSDHDRRCDEYWERVRRERTHEDEQQLEELADHAQEQPSEETPQ